VCEEFYFSPLQSKPLVSSRSSTESQSKQSGFQSTPPHSLVFAMAAAATLPPVPIREFGVTNKFCFDLLHGHDKLEKGTVMHGQRTTSFNGEGLWSRPTPIDQLDLANMRGQIWTLDDAAGTFQPFEFHAAPPEPMTANDNAFVAAFKVLLTVHGLTKILGLELLPHTNMREHIFRNKYGINYGTMLIPTEFSKLAQDEGFPSAAPPRGAPAPAPTNSRARSLRTRSARARCLTTSRRTASSGPGMRPRIACWRRCARAVPSSREASVSLGAL
jgi:hypothetical protein